MKPDRKTMALDGTWIALILGVVLIGYVIQPALQIPALIFFVGGALFLIHRSTAELTSTARTAQLEMERTKLAAWQLADRVANSIAVAGVVLELLEDDEEAAPELRDYARSAHARIMDANQNLKDLQEVTRIETKATAAA
jgi:hypothetical protein